jgi:hypothetical protein
MLASIISLLQDAVQPRPRPSILQFDHGGGGGDRTPGYDIVDIVHALHQFTEIPGEHPVARVARRVHFIERALPGIKEAREKREATAFLYGAALGEYVAEQKHEAQRFHTEQVIAAYDATFRSFQSASLTTPTPGERGNRMANIGIGAGGAFLLVGLGIGIGLAVAQHR